MNRFRIKLCFVIQFLIIHGFWLTSGNAQQIVSNRIEQMPNIPSPYVMRNWKQVAMGYDSLVFDLERTGDYLPLVWMDGNGLNYPEHNRFGLSSYVGSSGAEAINVLPAVIGATLAGIDKSNQDGVNWVLMCEEFFNKRPSENVYLNGFSAASGNDWWYDTMPNIFFYQLYALYPNIGDFEYQFRMVADRWLGAVEVMEGSAAPWHRAYMDYRAWALSTMIPLDVGVKEPEAAGAIGWLLYNAFRVTGEEKYRMGSEWCMEFLNVRNANPSYELQLPYGVYAAARMNAELGTDYDIEKMFNWCFDHNDNVRNWGATLGRWGDYDCDGLIGEAKYSGYAFAMNGFEQVGALVPMVRYDDRFARAVGKWALNCANASRLFYTNYLPDSHQDSEAWSHAYDPRSTIAHEALREYGSSAGTVLSPYATGDAIQGGWAPTNLALYGSSHVGILGGIIDTTHIQGILQLDVLKTDYFRDDAYPTYLYFNPHMSNQIVEVDLGGGVHDLYDAVSNTILTTGISGLTTFTVPADGAVLLVVVPTGGTVTYDLDRMLVDGVVVDYRSGQVVGNYPPRIKGLAAGADLLVYGGSATIYCMATDRDDDALSYTWSVTGGAVDGSTETVEWTAPDQPGTYTIACIVDDGNGGLDSAQIAIQVVEYINQPPVIDSLTAVPRRIHLGSASELQCHAHDPDGEALIYVWAAEYGALDANDSTAAWTAPGIQGFYYVKCTVMDTREGSISDSIGIVVQDTTLQSGIPVAYYPLNGNANDESGNDHHGTVKGALPTADMQGNADSAYDFNGLFDLIQVANHPDLNFQNAITVSFWMKPEELYSNRESYPISHGNWENRWKVSIIPEYKVRWTLRTHLGVKDLDSQTVLLKNVWTHVAALYDGLNFDLYLNGVPESHTTHTGLIMPTSLDLTIGQHLPDNAGYNFNGILDEIRIYDHAISAQEIQDMFASYTPVMDDEAILPDMTALHQNFPNPFNAATTIRYQLNTEGSVRLVIYNMLGQRVATLVDHSQPAGFYSIRWSGSRSNGSRVSSGIYFYRLEAGAFHQTYKLLLLE